MYVSLFIRKKQNRGKKCFFFVTTVNGVLAVHTVTNVATVTTVTGRMINVIKKNCEKKVTYEEQEK